ncbi:hypothetical protein QYM36_014790 [Artemia franciscana]|nr:hypothetical protein QYM36_014790 [Artemia franciscana]
MDPYLSATKNFYDSNTDYSPSSPQSAHKGHLQKFESGNEQGIKSSPPCLSSGQADSCVTPASSPTLRSNANPSSKSIPFGRKQFLESRKSKNFNEQGLKSKRPSLSSEQADDQIRTASCPTSEGVNLSKKQNTFRILVEGKGKPPRRNHLSEYHFDDRLMRFLSFNKREVVLMSEAYIWPAIQELRDTLIVQKVQTVYMIPLLNNLLSNDFPDDPLVIGPRNLIICASWEDCHQLGIEISKVLGQHKNELKYCCDLYGAFNDTSNVAKYTKRFDILAATLPAFMRLLDQHESNFTFSLDRCSAIVFENLDSLLRLHPDALARLLHYYSVSKKSKPEILRQVIACTTKWNNNVRVFKEESMESPLLFFPNMIEGALYAGVKFKISVAINKSKEKEELLKIMSNQPHDSRVVIFTKQGPDVVDDLVNFLAYNDFAVEGVYRLMKQGLLNDVQYKWNNAVQLNKGIVIVCSDDIWSDLAISNAHRTIHFDINEHSRLDFSRRMAASLDYYTTDKDTGLLPSPVPIHSHIILSESGGFNILSDMLKVVERSGTSIPNELSVLSNKIRLIKEKVKTEQLLCHTLKMFGECRDIGQCSQRHYVQKESDVPIGVSHGELIVRVTCVPEANVFNGVITKIINPDGIEKENTELSKLEKDMLEYFNGPNGRMSVGQSCKVNSLYAFENEKSFMRVKVLEILKKEERLGKPLRVAVKFIDTGRKAELDTYELLELPDHFHSIPKQALEFICCGVKPSDMDRSFDIRVKHVMEKKLLGSLIHGRIKLALGETIWLSPAIRLMIRSGKHCLGLSAKQMLIKENLAEENSDHLENLYKLCKEGGLALPDYTHTVTHKRTQQAYRDFLNREDYTIVFISFIVNPNKFFVTRTDKSQFLENLEQELQNSVLIPLKRVYNGLYCLAKFFQDGNLYRAQAVGEEEKGKVNVFFVDHGETESVPLSDLFEIDDWMLKKLPLQAIQCKLAGIEPADGNEYSQEASNYFWDLTRDKDFMLEFSAIVLDKKENIYDVALFQENAELSESLVQKNHANRLFFTNVVLRSEESDESETDEFETCNWQHFYDMLNYKPEKRKYLTKRKELQSGASTASASASKLEGKKKSSFTIYASIDESDSEKDCLLRDPRYDRLLPISDPDSSSSEESDFALSDDENRIPKSRKTFDF